MSRTWHRPIQIIGDTEQLLIRDNGMLVMGGEPVTRLMVVNPPADANFPVAPQGVTPAQEVTVRQKVLEESNVELINEMVTMLNANRLYNFAQKAITTQDNVLNKTANDLGRVQ
jgi:flagellar basal-body rod protein FlgG